MDWQNLFLTYDGRINRAKYWAGMGVSFALVLIGSFFFGLIPFLGAPIALVAFLGAAAVGTPIGIKRLHDRDKSGQWLILFYLAPAVLNAMVGASGSVMFNGLLGLVGLAIMVWGLIELGVLRGTEGENQYGDDPLDLRTFRTA